MGLFDNKTKTTDLQNTTGVSSGTTTGTTSGLTASNPYGPASGVLQKALARAGGLFNANRLTPYVPMNARQRAGLDTEYGMAKSSIPSLQAALGQTNAFSQGAGDISSAAQTGIGARALGPSYAEQYLGSIANGSQLGANDPNFERLLAKAEANAATEAGMAASGMGRTGSDYHQKVVADTVGDLDASQRLNRLNQQEQRQMDAIGAMESGRFGGLSQALNAYNSASGIQGANQDRRYGATQAIPGMTNALQVPGQVMAGVGDVMHNDALAKTGNPAANLTALTQILGGLTNGLGTTSTTGNTSGTQTGASTSVTNGVGTATGPNNTLGQILGGGIGLTSLLKSLGGSGGLVDLLKGAF
jgi:hypothetical protein